VYQSDKEEMRFASVVFRFAAKIDVSVLALEELGVFMGG